MIWDCWPTHRSNKTARLFFFLFLLVHQVYFHLLERDLQIHNSVFSNLRLFNFMLSIIQMNYDMSYFLLKYTEALAFCKYLKFSSGPCFPTICLFLPISALWFDLLFSCIYPTVIKWIEVKFWSQSYLTRFWIF